MIQIRGYNSFGTLGDLQWLLLLDSVLLENLNCLNMMSCTHDDGCHFAVTQQHRLGLHRLMRLRKESRWACKRLCINTSSRMTDPSTVNVNAIKSEIRCRPHISLISSHRPIHSASPSSAHPVPHARAGLQSSTPRPTPARWQFV
jgi:hypothetical protein